MLYKFVYFLTMMSAVFAAANHGDGDHGDHHGGGGGGGGGGNGGAHFNVKVGTNGNSYEVPECPTTYSCAVYDTRYLPGGSKNLYLTEATNGFDPMEVHHAVLYAVKAGHPYAELEHGSVLPNCFPERTDPAQADISADIIYATQHGNAVVRATPDETGIPIRTEDVQYERFLLQAHLHDDDAMAMRRSGGPHKVNFGVNLRLESERPARNESSIMVIGAYPHQIILGTTFDNSTTRAVIPRNGQEDGALCYGTNILQKVSDGVMNPVHRVGTHEIILYNYGSYGMMGVPVLGVGLHFHEYGRMAVLKRVAQNGDVEVLDMFHAHGGMAGHADNWHPKDGSQRIYPGDKLVMECTYDYTSVSDEVGPYFEGGEDSFRQMCLAFVYTGADRYARTTRLFAPDLNCNYLQVGAGPNGEDLCGKFDANPDNNNAQDPTDPNNFDSIATTWNLYRRSEAVIPYGCDRFSSFTDQCLDDCVEPCNDINQDNCCTVREEDEYFGCVDYARVPPLVPNYENVCA